MADLTGMMQAAAGNAGGDNLFIEDVFSTFLYTGTGAAQTITNNIDLDGEGGLVWIKDRDSGAKGHALFDTARGVNLKLQAQSVNGQFSGANQLTAFNATGFNLGSDSDPNGSGTTYCSWTFRKAPKFFDVVTYTGTGANRTVAHNLGSVPGSIWVKRTDTTGNWQVYHRANTAAPETDFLILNTDAATADSNTRWNDTLPTDTVFTVGTEATVNASAATYVAYLFAHDDGGFGDDGTENAITCGTFTTDGSANATVNLGYEPQWVLSKRVNLAAQWQIVDNMRGFNAGTQPDPILEPNTSRAEQNDNWATITSTGFTGPFSSASQTYIYIAIRRGPMKTPTAGTSVFLPNDGTGSTSGQTISTTFPVDLAMSAYKTQGYVGLSNDRLRGISQTNSAGTTPALQTSTTQAESDFSLTNPWFIKATNNNITRGSNAADPSGGIITWLFGRAPGFFDIVCYTGTGANRTVAHNLGVVPELMIMKKRSATDDWAVYAGDNTDFLQLNTTAATADDNTYWNDTSPTSTVFSVGTNADVNTSAATYVAYLFASLPGVQDIGTYTGNGTSLTVTTGFQPRFIMVKRTNSTGNWIVGDSARGLVAGDDPFLLLNSTAAETTNQDWVDVSATGFTVNETGANANVSAATYLYLAIS